MGMKEVVQQEIESLFVNNHEPDTIIFVDPEREYSYTNNDIMEEKDNSETTTKSNE